MILRDNVSLGHYRLKRNLMPISTSEIESLLEELGLQYKTHEDDEVIVPFHAEKYLNIRGENTILIVIQLSEGGEYIKFFSPMAFKLDNPDTTLETLKCLSIIAWKVLMVDFEYDHNDGEVRPTIDFPIEDGSLTSRQLHRCLTTIARVLDEFYEMIQHTINTGEIHERLEQDDIEAAMEQLEELTDGNDENDDAQEALKELKDNLEELRGLLSTIEDGDQASEENQDGDSEKVMASTKDPKGADNRATVKPTPPEDDFDWI